MRVAVAIAAALHAALSFLPIGAIDTTPTPDPVVRIRLRSAARAREDTPRVSKAQPAAEPATTTATATRRRASRVATLANTPAITRERASDETSPAATGPLVPSSVASIEDTGATLKTLGVTPPAVAAAANPFEPHAYANRVRSSISNHQRYPSRARRRGVEGIVVLAIAIDAQGGLATAPAIRRSSGSKRLDREALRMARAAAPFAAPRGARAIIRIDIPIRFSLDAARR